MAVFTPFECAGRSMFRIHDANTGFIDNIQTVSSALLCKVNLLAEQKNGIVDNAAMLEIFSCENDKRSMTGIDFSLFMFDELL